LQLVFTAYVLVFILVLSIKIRKRINTIF